MAFGPTLLPGTAAPGYRGTSVFAAHRDTHFRNLSKVHVGDLIRVEGADGKVTDYRVSKLDVRRWNSSQSAATAHRSGWCWRPVIPSAPRFAGRGGSSSKRRPWAEAYVNNSPGLGMKGPNRGRPD